MDKKSASAAVARLIELASKKKGWSIAKLNRHLGKSENTLHRWRSGKTGAFELASLIEMCRLAEVGMDDVFGIEHAVTAKVGSDAPQVDLIGLQLRVSSLETDLEAIRPLAQVVDGFAALIARQMPETVRIPDGPNLDPNV